MKKAITSGYGTNNHTTVIERADWSISFYDAETSRHYTRRVWYPIFGSTIYVQHRGGFYSIATEYAGKYDPQAISRYETVSADELKSMTAEIIAHRAGKQYADELTWEEKTRVYAYAVICNDADTEATMTAIVNGILQNRDEQPEPATTEAMPKKFRSDPRVTQNGVTYLLHDRAAIVTRTPDRRSVTIPDRIRHAGMSYAVTAIWDGTFSRTPKTARVILKCRHLETIEDAAIWERRSMLVVTYDESVYKWLKSTGARARIRYRATI